eukprot:CAMPEP_0197445218 /NCGR_PEP_ID=MMETSP1175-20131217/10488_1 /TAXON_ID=1003142 /ORGANISM="Triceratium dubium, Strain CCMP147" /LENGTH=125 /DNA_ID=CAMNT_0042976137 /DNA_START=186 /DNA_END=563 /DNA_ORIENTATION=+
MKPASTGMAFPSSSAFFATSGREHTKIMWLCSLCTSQSKSMRFVRGETHGGICNETDDTSLASSQSTRISCLVIRTPRIAPYRSPPSGFESYTGIRLYPSLQIWLILSLLKTKSEGTVNIFRMGV